MPEVTSLPISERILQAIAERANNTRNCREVYRPIAQPEDWTPSNMQIVVFGGDPTRVPEMDCQGNPPATAWMMPVHLHLNIEISENDLTPIQTALHVFYADCLKALTTPMASWHNWDGLAINTAIAAPVQGTTGSFPSIKTVINVWYRTDENDPYKVR